MITSTIQQGIAGTTMPSSANTSNSAYSMTPADFMQLMVTQLQNQDPTNPTSNSDLMAQMSDIGQLESSTDMQTTLTSSTLQSQIGSASALIGKTVTGINTGNKSVTGVVDSVSIAGSTVSLNLNSGDTVSVSNVSSIAPTSTSTTGATTGTPSTGVSGT